MSFVQPTPEWRQYYDYLSARPSESGLARRRFLQGLLATGALGASGLSMVATAPTAAAQIDDRVLVVVLMGGGNDGYSMVVPADDGRYVDARGSLALSPEESIAFEPGLYWNANLPGIAERYQAGDVAVVQGIGDPADDHSHFSSIARWMRGAADTGAPIEPTGWLGRWLDGAGAAEFGGIAVGDRGVPLHMIGNTSRVTALSPGGRLYGSDVEPFEVPAIEAAIEIAENGPGGQWPSAVAQVMAEAISSANVVSPIYVDTLPEDGLQRDMALTAEAINLGIGARVLTVAFGSFDTHDRHRPRQQELMLEFDQAIAAFYSHLSPVLADRVSIMTFSEFGRSWRRNDSAGIDHGTGSTALVIGSAVQGGLYGSQPDFSNFDENGDVNATVDFRSYYATVLDGWLQADSREIIGGSFEDLGIFTTGPQAPSHVAGDVDCDDEVTIGDALLLAQHSVGSREASGGCPITDPATQIHAAAGDINGDGAVDIGDALVAAQCSVGIDNGHCPDS